ncbi:glycosyltransferase family 2 protein [Paucibacter sp. KBW04]|uniref:glycosyltransferase family 2 protein n=1 Tax=Paucibacter sp. KBW04 TaxID=2153361 RepID=UPI0018CC6293|nr:glycosyltransferase family 2 protein [Paucibacter sp. KBW04]
MHFIKAPMDLALHAEVVVGVTHRNHPEELRVALESALAQEAPFGVFCLVLDDSSDEGWMNSLSPELLADPRIVIAAGAFGSPAQARNGLLDLVDQHFPNARWVARMDADDRFATQVSLRAMIEAGHTYGSKYVVGSNSLSVDGVVLSGVNVASSATLLDRGRLNAFIQAFCRHEVPNELPSCNLVLRTQSGIRYPSSVSAEDHWLVAGLLMHHPHDGCVVADPVYAVYSLGGAATLANKQSEAWTKSRLALASAADVWYQTHQAPGAKLLGWGQEGVVWRQASLVYKRFYPYAVTMPELVDIKRLADLAGDAVISFEPHADDGPGARILLCPEPLAELPQRWLPMLTRQFLQKLYRAGVVTSNVKRDNLRLTLSGELQYIDIGRDIVKLTASRFLDCAARLFAIGELGWSDHELARRKTIAREADVFRALPGFEAFYGELVFALHPDCDLSGFSTETLYAPADHRDVTLLIKCCPQDAMTIDSQVRHLVGELRLRARFAKTVLLVDQFEGPYLRQYAAGDLSQLLSSIEHLHQDAVLDEVWLAPNDPKVVGNVHRRWFAAPYATLSHTSQGAPVASQVWAFDRVQTPYVLQMDVDVFIGGTDASHDVLSDMKQACAEPGVWCVGFNIPQSRQGFKPYEGRPDQFAPEVRCGLLNLERIKRSAPFENPVIEGRLSWMWHRALQQAQPKLGMCSVRGGDSRTFYVHPRNEDKHLETLDQLRDLIGQGCIPAGQADAWDLVPSARWHRKPRFEDIVFLLFGRDTPSNKLERCFASLASQSCQDFGVVFIEDGGSALAAAELPQRIGPLKDRVTLIRRTAQAGYMANFNEAVLTICPRPESLMVVLDQDDALMHVDVVKMLREAWQAGADLINAPMFRPEKPLAQYRVDYAQPRQRGGGNVWSHLRAFRKSLFERVPSSAWESAPDAWCLSDFLTMVPMAELAEKPTWLDGPYLYWHQRLPYSAERKEREQAMKTWLFTQPSLATQALG